MTRRTLTTAALAALLAAGAGLVAAQMQESGRQELAPNVAYDGRFTFVRLRYDNPLGGGFGRRSMNAWAHDYNRAELHFGKILSEVSLVPTSLGGGNVLRIEDPELFKYPVAYMVEPGYWRPTDAQVAALGTWLRKGGFLIIDDFAGNQWFSFEEQMARVLPGHRLVKLEASHPVFDSFFRIASLEMTHPYYGAPSEFYGIFEDNDPDGRLMVMVNYNNDIAEYWEWSDTDFAPIELTNEAYKLGVNYVIYALTR
jgi:hypothetical protein